VLEAMFILLEPLSPSKRIFIGSHSLPPSLVRHIGPSAPLVEAPPEEQQGQSSLDQESQARPPTLTLSASPAASDASVGN
jgi:hypothetical protein